MRLLKYCLLISVLVSSTSFSFAQVKPVVTKVGKFKPPVVKTFLGVNQNGASVTVDEASQLVGLPLKITDDKSHVYKIDSYQFLYRKKSYVENDEGKAVPTFTIQSSRFESTPLPKIWITSLKDGFQKDEQLYFFDIVVKDKQGRRFFAPELKIMIQ